MLSSACQGLQLCLEPKVVESHFLRLKLAPPVLNISSGAIEAPGTEPDLMSHNDEKSSNETDDVNNKKNSSNDCKLIGDQNTNKGCWNFLQSLDRTKDSVDDKEIYVHPLVKARSPCILTEKGLELCTESLGSESGTEINDDILLLSSESACCSTSKPRRNMVSRRMSGSSSFPPPLTTSISGSTMGCNPLSRGKENLVIRRMSCSSSSFPPPLTSISGSNGVQVTSHREGGRLVLQAVNVRSCQAYLHAERSEGRLRLCLLKDTTPTTPILDDEDREDEQQQKQQQQEIVEEDGENGVVEDEVVGHEENGVVEDEVVHEENDVVEDGVEEEKCHWGDEDVNGKNGNVGGKIGKEKFARPSSCKERGCGRKRIIGWDTYLVAT